MRIALMENINVKTTGDFSLLDMQTRAYIPAGDEPVSVPRTHFINERIELGQLEEVIRPLDRDGDGADGGSLPGNKTKPGRRGK